MVKYGSTDYTSYYYFTWEAKAGTEELELTVPNVTGNNKGSPTNAIKSLKKDGTKYDNATLTVSVYRNSARDSLIGSKTLNVSKSKTGATGAAAVVYELQATPQQVNMSNWTNASTITFKVLKYEGSNTPVEIESDYEIKYDLN